jgi:hypothetical protein
MSVTAILLLWLYVWLVKRMKIIDGIILCCDNNNKITQGIALFKKSYLINGLCSINPDVERLCMTCEMNIDAEGNLLDYKFYSAVWLRVNTV